MDCPLGLYLNQMKSLSVIYLIIQTLLTAHALAATAGGQDFKPELVTSLGHSAPATTITFSSDGKLLATASADKTVKVWSVETGQELRSFSDLTANNIFEPSFISFSTDGKLLAVKEAYSIKVLDVASGKLLTALDQVASDFVFSSDGKSIIAVTDALSEKFLKTWSIGDWKETQSIKLQVGTSGHPVFSPNRELVAVVEIEGQGKGMKERIKVFDVKTGGLTRTFDTQTPEDYYDDILFSLDGKTLVSNDGKYLNVWDMATGNRKQRIQNSTETTKARPPWPSVPMVKSSQVKPLAPLTRTTQVIFIVI